MSGLWAYLRLGAHDGGRLLVAPLLAALGALLAGLDARAGGTLDAGFTERMALVVLPALATYPLLSGHFSRYLLSTGWLSVRRHAGSVARPMLGILAVRLGIALGSALAAHLLAHSLAPESWPHRLLAPLLIATLWCGCMLATTDAFFGARLGLVAALGLLGIDRAIAWMPGYIGALSATFHLRDLAELPQSGFFPELAPKLSPSLGLGWVGLGLTVYLLLLHRRLMNWQPTPDNA